MIDVHVLALDCRIILDLRNLKSRAAFGCHEHLAGLKGQLKFSKHPLSTKDSRLAQKGQLDVLFVDQRARNNESLA